ncbi:MAG: copper chaperone PCu(A)C [Pseudomonadota bacterium]
MRTTQWISGLLLGGLFVTATTALAAAPEIKGQWVREAPPSASMLAGFGRLHNADSEERALVDASSSAFADIELHETVEEDGVMRMIEQEAITVPAEGMRELKPGSYHLMLMRPHESLEAGDEVTITLTFDDGSEREVVFPVRRGGGGSNHGGQHGHGM